MHNLHDNNSPYNKTRLIIILLYGHCIEAQILGRKLDKQLQILFGTSIITNNANFSLKRTQNQLLIGVCFIITMNKFQGQLLDL